MGRDKACLELAGQPLFARALALLRSRFEAVIIAGDRPDLAREDIPTVPDLYPGSALGGLHAGLCAATTDWVFVMPCDMPYPDPRILELLLERRGGCDAVVPRTPAGCEPVFALYHKHGLPGMEAMLRSRRFRIRDFYRGIRVRYLDWQEMPVGWQRSLLNINTPAQWARLQEDLG